MTMIQQGDFSLLAKNYIHRTGYSLSLLRALASYCGAFTAPGYTVADVGAGTGKLTENLIGLGFSGYAVEPNDAMRQEGQNNIGSHRFSWHAGSGEVTGLPDSSVDWVLMASSFHWTDRPKALKEFYRILKPGGHFTALWNPRDLAANALHQRIEERINAMVPGLKRVSSGSQQHTQDLEQILLSTDLFNDLIFMEAPHSVEMSPDRYLGAWASVNDIRSQAGEKGFETILSEIGKEIAGMTSIVVPYKTRAWTIRSRKG